MVEEPGGQGGMILGGLETVGSGLVVPVGIEGPGSDVEPGIDGSGAVEELVSEEPIVLEPALVNDGEPVDKLVCDADEESAG